MILIYSITTTSRLQYICNFIFHQLLNCDFRITSDKNDFISHTDCKINYSNETFTSNSIQVSNHPLLFENDVRQQSIDCCTANERTAFFKTTSGDYPFDIFAASFYLLSRYEEYLPYQKDMYGRYEHDQSLAFREGFLELPLINIWVNDFAKSIHNTFPEFKHQPSTFRFIPTYDIDIAYSYKYKGWLRNIGGFLKSPSLERWKVLFNQQPDPFDSYEYLQRLHERFNLNPIFFFLVAAKTGVYDKNILPSSEAMQQLVKNHADKYSIGIHPSWQSGDDVSLLAKEKSWLENVSGQAITKSRQHYIRFSLPDSYRRLTGAGITDDYTMGYGSINGFRASVASSFYWFDLEKNQTTNLRIHPFCFMEANSFYEQHLSTEEAYNELMQYYDICKKVNGQLISIWHNNFLGTDVELAGWRKIYERFIEQVQD